MDRITANTLVEIGFTPIKKGGNDPETGKWGKVPTGEYSLTSFNPAPVIDPSCNNRNARIGSMSFTVTTQAELDRFLEKTIPAYCELI